MSPICGLINTDFSSFMGLINRLFKLYLYMFVIVLIYDILLYLTRDEHHASHLIAVVQIVKDREFYVKFFKCEISLESLHYKVTLFLEMRFELTVKRLR